MKNLLLSILLLTVQHSVFSQSEVILRLNHLLDGKPFALAQEANSPMGTKYKISRLQFYISGLKIFHDGGVEINLDKTYLFVDPSNPDSKEFSLGVQSDVISIDSIHFAIGVDAASNHLDPASFPITHPLAPKNPDMNWGWAAGYRFISFSGNSEGAHGAFTDLISIDGLGDSNYKINSYKANTTSINGKFYIDMDAEYNHLLDSIPIAGGAGFHGETGIAAELISNATLHVFSPGIPVSSKETNKFNNFSEVLYSGITTILKYSFESTSDLQFHLYNMNGVEVFKQKISNKEGLLSINSGLNPGYYLYSFNNKTQLLVRGKLIIHSIN